MTKIVQYDDTLLPYTEDITSDIDWLSATVPGEIEFDLARARTREVLDRLQREYARLQSKILELEANVTELEDGEVVVAIPEDFDDDLDPYMEDALREALARIIVRRGENQLEREEHHLRKNLMFAQLYGGVGEWAREWREKYLGTQESLETWTAQPPEPGQPIFPGECIFNFDLGVTVQEAVVASRYLAEVAAEANAEQEGLETLKAVATELVAGTLCHGCNACPDSVFGECDLFVCEIPDIDLDGQPLD
jgi:hypothetical protein